MDDFGLLYLTFGAIWDLPLRPGHFVDGAYIQR